MTEQENALFEKLRFDAVGLIPAIIQDAESKRVLTLAYMNKESLTKTLATRETWFYSRSRQALWHKGETSGHTQQVVGIESDCDGDALLVQVLPKGPACHTGETSCFDVNPPVISVSDSPLSAKDVLTLLEARVQERELLRPEGSYTTYLFTKGLDKILKKVGEESAEVIIAAKNRSADELRYEVADLLYHLFVLLREQGLPFAEILKELETRYQGKE